MATATNLSFDFSSLSLPPWTGADYEVIYLPFPEEAKDIPHPLSDGFPFFTMPSEAFDKTGKNLVCIREKRWMGNERIGTRPLPAHSFTQESLRPEAYAHITLDKDSPESLAALMGVAGLVIAPIYGSQRRFIDSRFHGSTEAALAYTEFHPLMEPDSKGKTDTNLLDLAQSVYDIAGQQLAALGGSDRFEEPFTGLCKGSLTEAVVLSEYARRVTCREDIIDEEAGGIISYYEVLLTSKALFGAMADLIDFSVAEGSLGTFEELAKARGKNKETRSIHNFALELLSSGEPARKRAADLGNVGSFITQEGLDFLERCVMQTEGVRWGKLMHQSAVSFNDYDGVIVKTPTALESQQSIYEKHAPRYLEDRYYEGSLSAALAAQFLTSLADPSPWKRCDNPECRTYFKQHFTTKGRSNPKATSCSPTCSARKRNRLYNMEATAVRTACKRCKTADEAVAYIESRLASEIELVDLPRARRRWREKLKTALSL